jgi:hypothetical protein
METSPYPSAYRHSGRAVMSHQGRGPSSLPYQLCSLVFSWIKASLMNYPCVKMAYTNFLLEALSPVKTYEDPGKRRGNDCSSLPLLQERDVTALGKFEILALPRMQQLF